MTDKFREPEEELPELRSLPRETPLPLELEDRVAAALRRHGLLAGRSFWGRSPVVRAAAAAAAAVLFFASGWIVGARHPSASPMPHQPTFVLLLREGPTYQPEKGSEQQRVAEYRAWAQKLRRAGVGISGEKLKEEAQVLTGPGAETLRPEGPGEALGAIRGFFFIDAADAQQAARIAKDCPHLRHGGTVEIRPIDPT